MANNIIQLNRPLTQEELSSQNKAKNNVIQLNRPLTAEELDGNSVASSIPFDTEIRAPKSPLRMKPMTTAEQAKTQNIGAISKISGQRISDVAKNYEGKTPETGLKRTFNIGMYRDPTSKQLIEGLSAIPMKAGITAGMLTNPISTIKGLAIAAPIFKGTEFLAKKGVEALPEKTPGELKELAETAGYAGGFLAGGKVLNKTLKTAQSLSDKNKIPNLINKATELYRDMLRPNQGEVKNIEIRKGKNIDDYYRLAAEEQLQIKQTPDKKLDTKLAREKLNNKLTEINTALGEKLKADKRAKFDLVELGDKAKTELQGSIKNATELKNAMKQVDEYIADEINIHGRYLNGEQLNQVKQGMWSVGYDALKPTAKSNARKIGFIAKEMIEKGYPDANIRQLNELSGKYATLSDLLENAQGRVIQGGKMGKYFAQTTGAITGAALGSAIPIPGVGTAAGAIGGKWAGGKISEQLSSPERISKIASKKAVKAGITGKSYKDIMNFQSAITPEIVTKIPENTQKNIPFTGTKQITSQQKYLPAPKGIYGSGFKATRYPERMPVNTQKLFPIQTKDGRILLVDKTGKVYGKGFVASQPKDKAFPRKLSASGQFLDELWKDAGK